MKRKYDRPTDVDEIGGHYHVVYCATCEEMVDTDFTELLDISEDIQGRDVYVFTCEYCGTKGRSNVYRRYR